MFRILPEDKRAVSIKLRYPPRIAYLTQDGRYVSDPKKAGVFDSYFASCLKEMIELKEGGSRVVLMRAIPCDGESPAVPASAPLNATDGEGASDV